MITSVITNTIMVYLSFIMATNSCPLINQEYKTLPVEVFQQTNKTDTQTVFNLVSYENTTEHKFDLTITYKAGDNYICKTFFVDSHDTYSVTDGALIFVKIFPHSVGVTKEYFIYIECLDIECN